MCLKFLVLSCTYDGGITLLKNSDKESFVYYSAFSLSMIHIFNSSTELMTNAKGQIEFSWKKFLKEKQSLIVSGGGTNTKKDSTKDKGSISRTARRTLQTPQWMAECKRSLEALESHHITYILAAKGKPKKSGCCELKCYSSLLSAEFVFD